MGLFDYTKKLRTGRTAAGKAAKSASEQSKEFGGETQAKQQAL